jgi:hypothetical protein
MNSRAITAGLFFITTFAILATPASAGDGSVRHVAAPHVANSYVVVFRDDVDATSAGAELGAKHDVKVTNTVRKLLKAIVITATEAQAKSISADPRVRYVEDNGISTGTGDQSPTPNWGLDRIDQFVVPLNDHYLYSYTGQGVTAYVLDSGVGPIADLSGRIARNINFVTVTGVRNPLDYGDCYGHGTQVASIIGGTTYGVAKNVTIINVRQLDCTNSGTQADFLDAMDWIVSDYQSHPGPAVINMSSRFRGVYQSVDEVVMRALNVGITFVCSAGNDADDACGYSPGHMSIPSNYSPNPNQYSTITVSGTNSQDAFFNELNYGPCVSILAPGQNTLASDKDGNPSYFGYTSGATAFVSGVAALHLERFPLASPSVIGGYIKNYGTPNQITGLPVGTPNLLLYDTIYDRRHACCVY